MNYRDKNMFNQNNINGFHLGTLSLLVIILFWKINDKIENCDQNYKTQDVLRINAFFFFRGLHNHFVSLCLIGVNP